MDFTLDEFRTYLMYVKQLQRASYGESAMARQQSAMIIRERCRRFLYACLIALGILVPAFATLIAL